jgi:hypothetical protein
VFAVAVTAAGAGAGTLGRAFRRRRAIITAGVIAGAVAGAVTYTAANNWAISLYPGGLAFTLAGAEEGVVAAATSVAVTGTALGAVAVTGAVTFAVSYSADVGFVERVDQRWAVYREGLIVAMIAIVAVLTVRRMAIAAASRSHQGLFVSVFGAGTLATILLVAALLSRTPAWNLAGPLLLFVGLLTCINAPFDWASVGLTRALLRRGVELRGWWPYILACIDAALAVVILLLLATFMIIGVQVFDFACTSSDHSGVLSLDALFEVIADRPGDPVNWWVYALLLSTLIPSLTNLLIGSASLIRGIPGISAELLRFVPAGRAVPAFDRAWIATVLTAQWAIGATLMLAAFSLLGWLVALLVPEIGTWFLGYARWLAGLDLPSRVWSLAAR